MNSAWIFWVFAPLVAAAFLANKMVGNWLTAEELSALFTGLGFVGVIAAFRHEREQAADDDQQHRELLRAMQEQVAAMTEQNNTNRRMIKVQAGASIVALFTGDLSNANMDHQSRMAIINKRGEFAKRLVEEAEKSLE